MVYCMSSDPTTIQVFYTKERRGHLTVRTGEEVLYWNEEDIDRKGKERRTRDHQATAE